jgi:hypothetical protein
MTFKKDTLVPEHMLLEEVPLEGFWLGRMLLELALFLVLLEVLLLVEVRLVEVLSEEMLSEKVLSEEVLLLKVLALEVLLVEFLLLEGTLLLEGALLLGVLSGETMLEETPSKDRSRRRILTKKRYVQTDHSTQPSLQEYWRLTKTQGIISTTVGIALVIASLLCILFGPDFSKNAVNQVFLAITPETLRIIWIVCMSVWLLLFVLYLLVGEWSKLHGVKRQV